MGMLHRGPRVALLSVPAPSLGAVALPAAHADEVNGRTPPSVCGTGIHTTYDDKSTYTQLAKALDTGTPPTELDTWHNVFNGPAEFDGYVKAHLGGLLRTPAEPPAKSDGMRYPELDTAAKANNRANYGPLAGRATVETMPGTFEQAVGPASSWSDVVHAQHLEDLAAEGNVSRAAVVRGAQAVAPRTRRSVTPLRPWSVVVDADAAAGAGEGSTEWYDTNHCPTAVTDAYDVPPALSSSAPSPAHARAQVAQLASDGASYISSDWITAPADGALGEVLTRG